MHHRPAPKRNLFRYGVYMWMVDLDELDQLSQALPSFGYNRRGLTTIHSRDHLGDPTLPIKTNLTNYLAGQGVGLDGGRVMLLTNARVLGYVFNPLSVYYCHDRDGGWRASWRRCTTPTANATATSCDPTGAAGARPTSTSTCRRFSPSTGAIA